MEKEGLIKASENKQKEHHQLSSSLLEYWVHFTGTQTIVPSSEILESTQ